MHQSAYDNVARFVQKYLPVNVGFLEILDVGSGDINGNLRSLFTNFHYRGLDIDPGPNVDIVATDPYHFPLPDKSIDVVVSCCAFEHVELFWLTFPEIARVLKSGGHCCIVAPSTGPTHGYPKDYWRFQAHAWEALARWEPTMELLETYIDTEGEPTWQDNVGIFVKR